MDPLLNPFAPGAGTPPPKLAGREEVLRKTEITLGRVKAGKPAKSFIVVGLRGVGKTVLLGEVYTKAEALSYCAVQIEAHENKALAALLLPKLRQVLLKLDRIEKARDVGNAALRVLAAFATAVKASVGDVEFSLSVDPDRGSADSGDLEADLADLLEAVGKAAKAKETAVALIIDEMQYLNETEMSALIMAAHRMQQRQLPVVLVGGGLPRILALAGRSKSYAERLFDYPRVGALEAHDAKEALADPIHREGMAISEHAIRDVVSQTRGYPYFLQTWGHFCWDVCETDCIDVDDVAKATVKALENLDESFFRVRFDRLTSAEKDYLFAMADLGPGPHRSGDVAARMNRKVESVAPTRSSLIKKGMVFSPSHGDTAFTVPMFDTYLRRVQT